MFKTLITTALFAFSTIVNAATATTTLSNLKITIDGTGIELYQDPSYYGTAEAIVYLNGYPPIILDSENPILEPNLSFDAGAGYVSDYGYAYASGGFDPSTQNFNLYTSVSSDRETFLNYARVNVPIFYHANTIVTLSVNAIVSGQGNEGDEFFSWAQIALLGAGHYLTADLYSPHLDYNQTKTLTLTYQSPIDGYLGFSAQAHSRLGYFAPPPEVAPIPEPGTYAMMLAGLGLLSFTGRRRNS